MDGAKSGDNIMISPFVLEKDGWHQATKRHYQFRMAELVTQNTPLGDKYRRHFLGLPAIEQPKPLLRSLKCAKACIHLGNVISEKEGCQGCAKYACAKKGETTLTYCTTECTVWEQRKSKHDKPVQTKLPQIVINALEKKPANTWKTIRFDETNLAPGTGGVRLNPSILKTDDGFLFAYRNTWGNANVSIIRLTKDFAPIGTPVKLNLHYKGATNIGREDPRLFWHKGKPHVWYIGWNGRRKSVQNNANVLFARLNDKTLQVEDKFFPKIPNRQGWEKNHSWFDHNGETHCIYSIVPHRVHKALCETVTGTWETPTVTSWQYGFLRGGASPVLHKGEYYHFFHGMLERNHKRLYSIGCAVFEARPPFRITRITHEPVDMADSSPTGGADVLFPGGAIFMDGHWCIAMGVHDAYSEIRFYKASDVERLLVKV